MLYYAPLSATYTPHGLDPVEIARFGSLLFALPECSWSVETQEVSSIGASWGGDMPSGNARLTLALDLCLTAPARATAERNALRLETLLNLHRLGILVLRRAWNKGAPTYVTRHRALVLSAAARNPSSDELALQAGAVPTIPPDHGAWAGLRVEFQLTDTEEI